MDDDSGVFPFSDRDLLDIVDGLARLGTKIAWSKQLNLEITRKNKRLGDNRLYLENQEKNPKWSVDLEPKSKFSNFFWKNLGVWRDGKELE